MILRPVREHAHLKGKAPQPQLVQRLAAGCHYRERAARQHHAAEQRVQVPRLGRGIFCCLLYTSLAAAARHSAQHGGRGNAVRADGMLRAHQQLPAADVQLSLIHI